MNLMLGDLKNHWNFEHNAQTPEQWVRYAYASVTLRLIQLHS